MAAPDLVHPAPDPSSTHHDGAPEIDVVWGAPSDEMIQAEKDGHIILIEDMTVQFAPPSTPGFRRTSVRRARPDQPAPE